MLEIKESVYELQGLDFSLNSITSCMALDESFNLSGFNFLTQKLEVRLYNFPRTPLTF